MATAKKLPSGSWRCQVFSHWEEFPGPDGTIKKKKIQKSFTCDDPSPKGKKKCEAMAAEWALNRDPQPARRVLTIKQAIDEYITAKDSTLSPSTIRAYRYQAKTAYKAIDNILTNQLDHLAVQRWINQRVKDGKKPKTVKNNLGLLTAALAMFEPDLHLRVTLPQQIQPDTYTPNDAEISTLIKYLQATDPVLLRAVYLAAFGTLRRSEICALDASDVSGSGVMVQRAMVQKPDNDYIIKTTKTKSSTRFVELPEFVLASFPASGRIVPLTPPEVSLKFRAAVEACGLHPFRFHDLRHYAASVMHALGIPDQYIMMQGGWSSDAVLKRIYRDTLPDYQKQFMDQAKQHFSEVIPHEPENHST